MPEPWLQKPKLLLLDEPAAGMNPQETDDLTAFIAKIRDEFGLTIFMIEHHMDLVMEISDRIYVLDFGKPIAEGVPEEIQNIIRELLMHILEVPQMSNILEVKDLSVSYGGIKAVEKKHQLSGPEGGDRNPDRRPTVPAKAPPCVLL